MPSRPKEPNGTTRTATALATTLPPLTNQMLVQPQQVRPPKIGMDASMVMATVGLMKAIGLQPIRTSGLTQTKMDTETTTSSTWTSISSM